MAILTGPEIRKRLKEGSIVIRPEPDMWIGPNSVDLHLGDKLYRYGKGKASALHPLDPMRLPPLEEVPLRRNGCWLLVPGSLYLGATKEYTETHGLVPYIDGRSSLGRLGVFAHVTAGRGDIGFKGNWTLEIVATEYIYLRPGGRYFQLTFHTIEGDVQNYEGRYQGDTGPQPSKYAK
jgi:dCTP deaminase